MTPAETARHRALAGERRARIVAELEAAPEGLDAAELGRRVGLHANTVRWHLRLLGGAGLVVSRAESRSTPGRPRVLYFAGDDAAGADAREEYRLLATVLAETLAREQGGPAASERAGRAWGAALAGGGRRGGDALETVVGILAEQGFEPEAGDSAIAMRRCPFHDLAEATPEVVCAVHRGLIGGALRELASPLRIAALEIFPRPSECVARLAPSGSAAALP